MAPGHDDQCRCCVPRVSHDNSAHAHAGEGSVRVNANCPGLVEARMTAGYISDPALSRKMMSTAPIGRVAKPAELARAVAFLASDDASYITGCVLPVDGGLAVEVRKKPCEWDDGD